MNKYEIQCLGCGKRLISPANTRTCLWCGAKMIEESKLIQSKGGKKQNATKNTERRSTRLHTNS
jgi:ribosomal protein S27E